MECPSVGGGSFCLLAGDLALAYQRQPIPELQVMGSKSGELSETQLQEWTSH